MAQMLRVVLFAILLVGLPSQLEILVEDFGSYPYILAAKRQSATIRRAMRYHGTCQAFSDGSTWFFRDRDGKLCRLFTASCRRSVVGHPDEASES
jgi:hypothetical protein